MSEPANASNFDERINRLIERHEALTETVEHMALQGEEQNARIAQITEQIDALVRLAQIQNERLTRLEGGPA